MLKRSLGLRIIALVIIAFAIFTYAILKAEDKQIRAKTEQMVKLLSNTIYSGLSEAMLEGRTDKVQRVIENYSDVEEIDSIRIFDPENGSILVDADRTNVGSIVDQRHMTLLINNDRNSALFSENGKQILTVITPILNEPKCYQCHDSRKQMLGVLDIDVSVSDMFQDMASSRLRMIAFSLITVIGVSLVIMLFVVLFVNRPIRELVAAMSEVESGDLTVSAPVVNNGELGKLGKSFNSMTAKLRGDIERLESLHKTAEELRNTMDLEDIERVTIRGIAQGMGFERVALLLVNQEKQTLEGGIGIGIVQTVLESVRIPLHRKYGILAETVLDAKPSNVQGGIYDLSLAPAKTVRCWEVQQCSHTDCPAYGSDDLRCWLLSETHCWDRNISREAFENKAEICCRCSVIQEVYGEKAALVLLMFGSRAFATVPLMAQDKVTGVIVVDNLYSERPITDEDVKGLSIFADQSGMAIENARLYRKLEGRIEAADEELGQKVTALTEMKNFNDSILQNMSNGLITADMEGKIVYLNSVAEAILGYQLQAIRGKAIGDVFGDLGLVVSETLGKNRGFAFHETLIHKETGGDIPVEVSTSLLRDDVGEATGIAMLLTDLTERKEMERQVRRADRLATLGQLAAGIAHEIRNPLAGISGAVQILRDDTETDSRREIFDQIIERIDTLDSAISNFLRFARPAPLQLSPTDINAVVRSVLFLISKQAETQGVSITEEYDGSLPIVMADSEQIQQVILNIAINSLQAISERNGRITFRTSQAGNPKRIVIEISDTGVGIPDDKMEQIFAPYFTTKSEGTGLGLSIAQRIVEEHGGAISVESEVSNGTMFKVELRYG